MSESTSPQTRYAYHGTTAWGARRKQRSMSRLFDGFLPQLPRGSRILEIGAGRGEFASEALRRGFEYVGIEASDELRSDLERRGVNVLKTIVPPIPARDGSLDLIHSMDVFEHLGSYQEVMALCEDAYRALKPGGYLSIVAPNFDTQGMVFWYYEYQHSFVTNKGRLEGVLKDSGFQPFQTRTFLTGAGLTRWRSLDRVAAYSLVPPTTSRFFCGLLRGLGCDKLLFQIHKSLCDHVGVIGQRPA